MYIHVCTHVLLLVHTYMYMYMYMCTHIHINLAVTKTCPHMHMYTYKISACGRLLKLIFYASTYKVGALGMM